VTVSNIELLDLWLPHCLTFKDIREEHENGMHQDSKKWRETYMVKNSSVFSWEINLVCRIDIMKMKERRS
jgi:hypothetical protein